MLRHTLTQKAQFASPNWVNQLKAWRYSYRLLKRGSVHVQQLHKRCPAAWQLGSEVDVESAILPFLFDTYREIVTICSKLPCYLAANAGGSTSHQCAELRHHHTQRTEGNRCLIKDNTQVNYGSSRLCSSRLVCLRTPMTITADVPWACCTRSCTQGTTCSLGQRQKLRDNVQMTFLSFCIAYRVLSMLDSAGKLLLFQHLGDVHVTA